MRTLDDDNTSFSREKSVLQETMRYAIDNPLKSWTHILATIASVLCAYLIILLNTNVLISYGVSTLLALLLVRFFVIYHDYAHQTILRQSIPAKIIFTVFGLFILAPMSVWHRSHSHHHHHNSKLNFSGIGDYPILTKKEYLARPRRLRFLYHFQRHPFIILNGYLFTFLYGMCLHNLFFNFKKHPDALAAIIVHVSVGVSVYVFGGVHSFLLAFLLPAFLSGCVGTYLFYVQHNYPLVIHFNNQRWSYFSAAVHSSVYLEMNPVMQWFTGNIGFHHIHHFNPAIPFYNLPEVYRVTSELRKASDTTLHPIEILKCLRLKVWDEEENRMTGI